MLHGEILQTIDRLDAEILGLQDEIKDRRSLIEDYQLVLDAKSALYQQDSGELSHPILLHGDPAALDEEGALAAKNFFLASDIFTDDDDTQAYTADQNSDYSSSFNHSAAKTLEIDKTKVAAPSVASDPNLGLVLPIPSFEAHRLLKIKELKKSKLRDLYAIDSQVLANAVLEENNRQAKLAHTTISTFSSEPLAPAPNSQEESFFVQVYLENLEQYLSFFPRLASNIYLRKRALQLKKLALNLEFYSLNKAHEQYLESLYKSTAYTAKMERLNTYFSRELPRDSSALDVRRDIYGHKSGASAASRSSGPSETTGYRRGDAVRSDADLEQIIRDLAMLDNQMSSSDSLSAQIPDMLLDTPKYIYHDTNSLIKDPLLEFNQKRKSNATVCQWHPYEIKIYKDKYRQYPKLFHKIAESLPGRAVSECVAFYYNNKKTINFKELKNQPPSAKRKKSSSIPPPPSPAAVTITSEANHASPTASSSSLSMSSASIATGHSESAAVNSSYENRLELNVLEPVLDSINAAPRKLHTPSAKTSSADSAHLCAGDLAQELNESLLAYTGQSSSGAFKESKSHISSSEPIISYQEHPFYTSLHYTHQQTGHIDPATNLHIENEHFAAPAQFGQHGNLQPEHVDSQSGHPHHPFYPAHTTVPSTTGPNLHYPTPYCGDGSQHPSFQKMPHAHVSSTQQSVVWTNFVKSFYEVAQGDGGHITGWKLTEIESLVYALRDYGKNWAVIASFIPFKPEHQIRAFYLKYKKVLGIDRLVKSLQQLQRANQAALYPSYHQSMPHTASALVASAAPTDPHYPLYYSYSQFPAPAPPSDGGDTINSVVALSAHYNSTGTPSFAAVQPTASSVSSASFASIAEPQDGETYQSHHPPIMDAQPNLPRQPDSPEHVETFPYSFYKSEEPSPYYYYDESVQSIYTPSASQPQGYYYSSTAPPRHQYPNAQPYMYRDFQAKPSDLTGSEILSEANMLMSFSNSCTKQIQHGATTSATGLNAHIPGVAVGLPQIDQFSIPHPQSHPPNHQQQQQQQQQYAYHQSNYPPSSTSSKKLSSKREKATSSYWTADEKNHLFQLYSKYGNDWSAISHELGTKSQIQIRNFFLNLRKKPEFEKMLNDNPLLASQLDSANKHTQSSISNLLLHGNLYAANASAQVRSGYQHGYPPSNSIPISLTNKEQGSAATDGHVGTSLEFLESSHEKRVYGPDCPPNHHASLQHADALLGLNEVFEQNPSSNLPCSLEKVCNYHDNHTNKPIPAYDLSGHPSLPEYSNTVLQSNGNPSVHASEDEPAIYSGHGLHPASSHYTEEVSGSSQGHQNPFDLLASAALELSSVDGPHTTLDIKPDPK